MKYRLIGVGALALALLASQAAAEDYYICDVTSHSRLGWIPSRLLLGLSKDRQTGLALDGYIKNFSDVPILVDVTQRNASSYQFNWRLNDLPIDNRRNTIDAEFRAILNLKNLRVTIQSIPSGIDQDPPRGSGRCKPIEAK